MRSRVLLASLVVGVPLLIVPGLWLPGLWSGRDFQEGLLLVLALFAVGSWALLTGRGPLRWVGVLLGYLGIQAVFHGFQPLLGLLSLSLILAVVVLGQSVAPLPSRVFQAALAILGVAHLAFFVLTRVGVTLQERVWFWGLTATGRSPIPILTGIGENANVESLLLVLAVPWMLLFIHEWPEPWGPTLFLIGVALWALIAFQAWGGILAAGCAVVAWAATASLRRGIYAAGVGTVALLGYGLLDLPTMPDRITASVLALQAVSRGWRPFLFGRGLSSWGLYSFGVIRGATSQWLQQMHNEWMQVWFELGLVGLGLFVALVGSVWWAFWQVRHTPIGKAGLASSAAYLVGLTGYFPLHIVPLAAVGLVLILLAERAVARRRVAPDARGLVASLILQGVLMPPGEPVAVYGETGT